MRPKTLEKSQKGLDGLGWGWYCSSLVVGIQSTYPQIALEHFN